MFVAAFALTANAAAPATNFARNLMQGSTGTDVKELQMFLNACPDTMLAVNAGAAGSAGHETMTFGPATKAAVMEYQSKNGVITTGNFYTLTRGKASTVGNMCGAGATFAPAGCVSASGFSPVTGGACYAVGAASFAPAGCTSASGFSPVTGGACYAVGANNPPAQGGALSGTVGTIDYSLTSGISNEEVGEDENDVKVAGLELDLEDSDSDVQVTAIKVNFDVGTAANDFEDYADEVSVWLGTTKVATVDADEFNDDNDFEKTISLSNAVVRQDETKDLYVAVSAVSNLDTADVSDTWTVDFTLVRFIDAQGATTSEDPTENAVTFSFESFATATDVELKITTGDEDVNDAHIIDVDATDDTDDVSILSFNMEAEGDSDIVIDALPVTLTSVEATGNDPADLISTVYLYAGNTEIGSENLVDAGADSSEVVVFDDLDYTIDAGEDVEFTVKAKFYSIADSLDAGDTIQATFGEVETDAATFEVEDESGTELADGDKTGTVTGGTHEVRDTGINVEFVSGSAVRTFTADATGEDDQGTYTINFDVTAFGADMYIDNSSEDGGYATGTYTLAAAACIAGETYTATINGTAVVYTALVGDCSGADAADSAAILAKLAIAIDADGTVGPLVNATSVTTTLYLTAVTAGAGGNYTTTAGDTSVAGTLVATGAALTGGANANAAGQGVEFSRRSTAGTAVLNSDLVTSSTTDANDTADTFQVEEGQTRHFTLTVIYSADSTPVDGSVEVFLESINWGTATDDTNANYYTFDLGDYKTGYLFLNGIA